jgi:hypothetical protein
MTNMSDKTRSRRAQMQEKSFSDYAHDGALWITLSTGEYYPDILPRACDLYQPVLVMFGQLLKSSHSSQDLLINIGNVSPQWMRVQLSRVFRKYVSPDTPVEMLKKKTAIPEIIKNFGKAFRQVAEVQRRFAERPMPDEALCAVLWEYKDRGQKGYDLTRRFFQLMREKFPQFKVTGPERAGRDILMGEVFSDYPKPDRPVDFIVYNNDRPLAIGLARYDSDRGGAQEDDRTGQYRDCAQEILQYSKTKALSLKVIFLNDGPGLLLGSMWRDYAHIEKLWGGKVKVVTLRMVPERITLKWLLA